MSAVPRTSKQERASDDAGSILLDSPYKNSQIYSSSEAMTRPAARTRRAPTIPTVCRGCSPRTKKAMTAVHTGIPVKTICKQAPLVPYRTSTHVNTPCLMGVHTLFDGGTHPV